MKDVTQVKNATIKWCPSEAPQTGFMFFKSKKYSKQENSKFSVAKGRETTQAFQNEILKGCFHSYSWG